jgi:hypothetical protein
MVVKFRKNLTQREYLYKLFEIIDVVQIDPNNTTSNTEKKVMVEFYNLPEPFDNYRFSTLGRAEVLKRAPEGGWELSRQNMNNKIYELLKKGWLFREPDGVIRAKPWIEKTINSIKKAYKEGTEYDIKLRFTGE